VASARQRLGAWAAWPRPPPSRGARSALEKFLGQGGGDPGRGVAWPVRAARNRPVPALLRGLGPSGERNLHRGGRRYRHAGGPRRISGRSALAVARVVGTRVRSGRRLVAQPGQRMLSCSRLPPSPHCALMAVRSSNASRTVARQFAGLADPSGSPLAAAAVWASRRVLDPGQGLEIRRDLRVSLSGSSTFSASQPGRPVFGRSARA